MTSLELKNAIHNIKLGVLAANSLYLRKKALCSTTTSQKMVELLDALYVYLIILEYYDSVEDKLRTSIKEEDIFEIFEQSKKVLFSMKKGYYE
jgi:hypothetical protein